MIFFFHGDSKSVCVCSFVAPVVIFFSFILISFQPAVYPSSTTIGTQRWFEYFNGNYLFICCFRLFSFLVIFFRQKIRLMSVTKYSDTLTQRTLKVIYVFRRQAGYENKHHILHRGMKKADSFEISTSLAPVTHQQIFHSFSSPSRG